MIRVRRVAAFARARGAFARRATPTSTRSSASLVARTRRDLASRARSVARRARTSTPADSRLVSRVVKRPIVTHESGVHMDAGHRVVSHDSSFIES
jgi:hypothetical protein